MADENQSPIESKLNEAAANKKKNGSGTFVWGALAGAVVTFIGISFASKWLRSHQKIVMVTPEGTATQNLNEPSVEAFETLEGSL